MKANFKNTALAAIVFMAAVTLSSATDFNGRVENGSVTDNAHDPVSKSAKDKGKEEMASNKAIAVPYFRIDDELLSVNILSLDASPVEISIYDSRNELLHSEVLKGKQSLGKRFDFSEVSEGTYLVVVKHKKNTFTETVKI